MQLKDFIDCYVVPGHNGIIDVIRPDNGLTWHFGHSELEIKRREPLAIRVNFEQWQQEKAAKQDGPIIWNETTEEQYHEMLNVLPPAMWQGGAFLVGEPMDHHAVTGQPRFQAYWRRGDRYLESSRPLRRTELTSILANS